MKMLLAGILGVCASLLVACGTNSKLISSGNAGPLQSDFDAVANAVSSGDCSAAATAVQKAQSDVSALPPTTDAGLKSRLQQGVDALAQRAPTECTQSTQSTASTQSTTTAPTTNTQTTTTATSTTDSTPTATTNTDTRTQTTPPPSDTTPAPPPVPDNGGGTPAPGDGNGGGAGKGTP